MNIMTTFGLQKLTNYLIFFPIRISKLKSHSTIIQVWTLKTSWEPCAGHTCRETVHVKNTPYFIMQRRKCHWFVGEDRLFEGLTSNSFDRFTYLHCFSFPLICIRIKDSNLICLVTWRLHVMEKENTLSLRSLSQRTYQN